MTQTYKVQVSMNQAHIVESGFVWKQGDFGFNIEIEVLDFDTTGATPQIIFRKSSGAVEATQITRAGNKFTYAIRGTELDTPGPCVCDLKLKDSTTKRVSTASFKYFVIPDTMDGLNQQASSYSDTIAQILAEYELDVDGLMKTIQIQKTAYDNSISEFDVLSNELATVWDSGYYAVSDGQISFVSSASRRSYKKNDCIPGEHYVITALANYVTGIYFIITFDSQNNVKRTFTGDENLIENFNLYIADDETGFAVNHTNITVNTRSVKKATVYGTLSLKSYVDTGLNAQKEYTDSFSKVVYLSYRQLSNGSNTFSINVPNNNFLKKLRIRNNSANDGYVAYQLSSESASTTVLVSANSESILDVSAAAYGTSITINNMSSRTMYAELYAKCNDTIAPLENAIGERLYKIIYLMRDASFSSSTATDYSVNIKSGVKKTLEAKNTSGASGYLTVKYNDVLSVTELFDANETKTFTIPDYISTDKITITSLNSRTFKISLYYEITNVADSVKTIDKTAYVVVSADGRGDFASINDALTFLKRQFDVVTYPATIFIKNGLYEVSPSNNAYYSAIEKGVNKISIIGESREGVIIKCTNTSTAQNKVLNVGGPCVIKNLSIYCLKDNTYTADTDLGHNCYAIHVDDGTLEYAYDTVIENCYFYSECHAPIGAGLRKNQRQIYRDVVSEANGFMLGSGAFYIHAPQQSSWTGCSVILDNVTGISKNEEWAIGLADVSGSIPYTEIPTTIRRSIFVTNGEQTGAENFKTRHLLTSDSQLNNLSDLNYQP